MGAVPAWFGKGTAILAHLVGRQIVDIGLAGLDQMFGPMVELLEIVGGEFDVPTPIEAKPANIILDGVDEFLLFLGRVGVVKPQIAAPAEFLGDAKIQTD